MVRKVIADLGVKGVAMTQSQVRVKLDELMAQAVVQVKAGSERLARSPSFEAAKKLTPRMTISELPVIR